MASPAFKDLFFLNELPDLDGWIIPGTKMTNTGPFFVIWNIKNPTFHWYLILFLSEAVEASRCHFFENWLMKHKYPHLLKPLGTINQKKILVLLSLRANLKSQFRNEIPCILQWVQQSISCPLIIFCHFFF